MRHRTWQERLWSGLDKSGANGCWLWTRAVDAYGYGAIRAGGTMRKTHRLAYELLAGPIPDGLQLDHLCRVRHCANPSHLEPVTSRENSQRGVKAKQETCQRGHHFDAENTRRRANGRRTCRRCEFQRRHARRRSGALTGGDRS